MNDMQVILLINEIWLTPGVSTEAAHIMAEKFAREFSVGRPDFDRAAFVKACFA